ncbi:dynein regulatory complex protein 9 [Halyomorpha halys]|uniref:dynein regulatory complex protein 9 n=1 Tax=Halyomorpha halys TaxID=286706 RepID=UPI0006D4F9BE|nr:IQ domain-containing protein G [Halyomorpha halys]
MPWLYKDNRNPPVRNPFKTVKPPTQDESIASEEPPLNPKMYRLVLSPMETMLASAVLSEMIQYVNIFLAKLPQMSVNFVFEDVKMRSKQPIKPKVTMTDEDTAMDERLSSHLMMMKTLLIMTRDELLQDEEPAALYVFNDLTYWAIQSENDILKSHKFISEKIVSARMRMRTAKEMAKQRIAAMESGMAVVEAGFEEVCSIVTIFKEYAAKFQKAQIEQNDLKIQMAEKSHKKMLYNRLKAIEDEHRANQLIKKYINSSTEKLEHTIATWSKKYDQDMEEIDLKIVRANQDIPDLVYALGKLLTTYYKREMEMLGYIKTRNHRMKLENIGRFMEFFAIRIQAWWKGTMVRWEIGPAFQKKKRKYY